MEDLLQKRHRQIDYKRIICVLGLQNDFIDYFYNENRKLMSARRKARYFLQKKKVDILSVDMYIKEHDVTDYGHLFQLLNGRMEQCYL